MKRVSTRLLSFGFGMILCSFTARAEALYYNIVPHATGSDCPTAKAFLTSTQLYTGTGANSVPTVTDTTLTYTVESQAEATQLCSQVGATPADLLDPDEASQYQPSAHPWVTSDTTGINAGDDTCATDDLGNNYTYLQLAGHCNP
jgi:hypothetical protein